MSEEEWNSKTQVKMGSIGEKLIFEYLSSQGVQCYGPLFPGAHKIDWMGFAIKPLLGYAGPLGIEAKTKRHRDNYADTGVDFHLFDRYQNVSLTMPVLMCFCDTSQGYIYGNYLHSLEEPISGLARGDRFNFYRNISLPWNYPSDGSIRFWRLDSMCPFRRLTEEECTLIESYETRADIYQQKPKWFYPFSNPGLL